MKLKTSFLCTWLLVAPFAVAQQILVDHTCDLNMVPTAVLDMVKTDLHVAYNHTSHGSQLVSGMSALYNYPPFAHYFDYGSSGVGELEFHDYGIPGIADLSQGDYIDGNGVTPWVTSTRAYLDNAANLHINVVMWSWCSINGHNIPRYLENMEILVAEYGPGGSKPRAADHPVTFVFMTGHAEGQGETGFIYNANQQIRAHCASNGRVLFDFADIESYNPDGDYFYNLPMWDNLNYGYSGGNWGVEWTAANSEHELSIMTLGDGDGYNGCSSCAHSDSPRAATLNCVLKGRATWYMFARIWGWQPGGVTPSGTIEILDQNTVQLRWNDLVPGSLYELQTSPDGLNWSLMFPFTASSTSYVLPLVHADDEHACFRVVMATPSR